MITGIHFILSYMCNQECDHCFVYSGPSAQGTFRIEHIRNILDDALNIDSMEWVFFEGGEPFLFYPILLEAVKSAREKGFKVGIVTNSYFATSEDDLEYWLRPFADVGISNLTVSDDRLHFGEMDDSDNPAERVRECARGLSLPTSSLCVEDPKAQDRESEGRSGIDKYFIGGIMFRGRAVDKLGEGLPKQNWESFTECPHEDLLHPHRVHIDPYGNVHLCQGILMGNVFETPLSELVTTYDGRNHPICQDLVEGGPAALRRNHTIDLEDEFLDACHLCFVARRSLMDTYPAILSPPQVYGNSVV